ncbi:MAG: rhomboid family intramembrane serine protease [Planctomycetaceae bacterium]
MPEFRLFFGERFCGGYVVIPSEIPVSMIPIPISTDAPIYHFPFATIGLMLANFVCFVVTGGGDPERTIPWVLEWGHLNPIEWVTSMFAHAGIGHLVGNLFFLWGFGLVVEGKIGWFRMLVTYMLIGLGQAAFLQVIMLPWQEGGALGASSAIMGLMAISLVWAPKNDLKVFMFLALRVFVFDVTIMWYAVFYLGWELIVFALFDQGMGTAALHLSGAMFGFAAGVLFLKKGWVDCENWDLFRVLSGNYGRFADSSTTVGSYADPRLMFGTADVAVRNEPEDNSHKAQNGRLLKSINALIDQGDVITASEKLFDLRMKDSDSQLTEKRLKKLSIGLLRANMPDDAEIYVEEYIERFPDNCAWARVRMAQLLLTHHRRPNAALQMLKRVRLSELHSDQQAAARKIAQAARKEVQAGVQDAEPEW